MDLYANIFIQHRVYFRIIYAEKIKSVKIHTIIYTQL